jgi:DNA-binding transcriptional MerR regulator
MNVMDSEVRVATGKACQILGVHPNTLRRWADTGLLPSTRLPGGANRLGERRFLISDLEQFQKEHSPNVN